MGHGRGGVVTGLRAAAVALWVSLLMTACGTSDDGESRAPGGPSGPPAPTAPVSYTAIGASDAVGIGASVPCLAPFVACPDGTGYVPALARALRERGAMVTLMNMGWPGAVMSPDVQQIGASVGIDRPFTLLQNEAPFVPRDSTLVTIFAGGNDATTLASAIDRGATAEVGIDAWIDRKVAEFTTDYGMLVDTVRARAPNARIIVLNLPNFARLPFTDGFEADERQWIGRLSVGFGRAANTLAPRGIAVIDLLCDPRSYDRSNYSSDGFHPNDTGYAYLAAELLRAVDAPTWPAPAASCTHTGNF